MKHNLSHIYHNFLVGFLLTTFRPQHPPKKKQKMAKEPVLILGIFVCSQIGDLFLPWEEVEKSDNQNPKKKGLPKSGYKSQIIQKL